MELITREAPPAHLLFKIKSFSLIDQYEVVKHETKEFEAGNYKWRLVIYPNGQGIEDEEEYVSVYLAISDTKSLPRNWEVNAVFSFFIYNQISGNYLHSPGKTSRFFSLKKEWGIPKFISQENLTIPSNGYLVDDSCVFGAEVSVIDKHSPVTEYLSLKKARTVPHKHSINISNFSTLKSDWYSEEFTAAGSKWKINVCPNGDDDKAGHSLSIYLCYVASDTCGERRRVSYTFCLKNQLASGENHNRTGTSWFDASNSNWGFGGFIPLAKLDCANSGFIVKDTCILEVETSLQAIAHC